MKKLKQLLKEKLGMTKSSHDDEYDLYQKKLEEHQKLLSEKSKLLKEFQGYIMVMLRSLSDMTEDFVRLYSPSDEIDDPMKSYLLKIIVEIEKASKIFDVTNKKIDSEFTDQILTLKKYTTPLKVEMKERDGLKVVFDDAVSSMKRFLSKTKKRDQEKFAKEKDKLKKSLDDYNAKNMYIKEQMINFLSDSAPVSDTMLIMFCLEYGKIFFEIKGIFERVRKVVNDFDTHIRRIRREKLENRKTVTYFLDDKFEISTIVADKIYLGSREGAKDKELLKKNGIRTVVNCSIGEVEPVKNYYPQDFKYHEVVLSEKSDNFLVFDEFMNIMDNAQPPIFVHCFGGINRSPTLLIAYFIRCEMMRTKDIFPILQERRRFVHPSVFMLKQLFRYEQKVFNEKGPFLEFVIYPPRDCYARRMVSLHHGGKITSPGELEAYEEYEEGKHFDEDMEDDDELSVSSDEEEENIVVDIPNDMTLEELNSEIKKTDQLLKKKEDELRNRTKWYKKETELRGIQDINELNRVKRASNVLRVIATKNQMHHEEDVITPPPRNRVPAHQTRPKLGMLKTNMKRGVSMKPQVGKGRPPAPERFGRPGSSIRHTSGRPRSTSRGFDTKRHTIGRVNMKDMLRDHGTKPEAPKRNLGGGGFVRPRNLSTSNKKPPPIPSGKNKRPGALVKKKAPAPPVPKSKKANAPPPIPKSGKVAPPIPRGGVKSKASSPAPPIPSSSKSRASPSNRGRVRGRGVRRVKRGRGMRRSTRGRGMRRGSY